MDGNAHHLRRRLSAVLCADVVGYSAHMHHDERATHLAYKACVEDFIKPLVSENFGKIVKSTGDGFFALFDSVVAAMECAIAIQSKLPAFIENNSIFPALQFRLGVNSGDIISEKEDIYGNDVNLAARLQEQAQPGSICITAGTYEQVKNKLSAQFEDLGDITFKNESSPTQVYACYPLGFAKTDKKSKETTVKIAASVAVVCGIALSGYIGMPYLVADKDAVDVGAASDTAIDIGIDRPSIAVLAFEDLSDSPETRSLSLGIGDTIATTLAASQRFFVIDPKSSLEFSSNSPSLKDIARQLNVRFLLLGNVNQKGDKIRINTRLVDMNTGRNHWAYSGLENIDRIFDIEDKIANDVIAALSEGPKAPAGKGIRGATRNIAAYRSFLRGWQLLKSKPSPDFDSAISLFEAAILNDPNYGNAHAALAEAFIGKSYHVFRAFPQVTRVAFDFKQVALSDMWIARQSYLDKARTHLTFALKDPTAYAYRISSQMHYINNDNEAAARDSRNAYLRDPGDADSAAEYGMSLIWNGELNDGVREIEKAIRINPKSKLFYAGYLGIENFASGKYRAAQADLESALSVDPHNERTMIHLIATYGHLGEVEKSRKMIVRINKTRAMRGLAPVFIQRILRKVPYKLQSSRLHLAAGLHKAGVKFGIKHSTED